MTILEGKAKQAAFVALVVLLLLGSVAVHASTTEEVYVSLVTLAEGTAGRDHVNSFIAHFCLTTRKALREGQRGWYTKAQTDYAELKGTLSSEDLTRYKAALLAFEDVFYHYDGN